MKFSDKFSINHNKFSFCIYIVIVTVNIKNWKHYYKICFEQSWILRELFVLEWYWIIFSYWNMVDDAIVCPSNYNIICNDRKSRNGGVAVIYKKSSLKVFKIKNDLISINNTNFEHICIDKIFKKLKIRLFCVYLLPFLQNV